MSKNITKNQIKEAIESFDLEKFYDKERIEKALKQYADEDNPEKISLEGQLLSMLSLSQSFTSELLFSVLTKLLVEDKDSTN